MLVVALIASLALAPPDGGDASIKVFAAPHPWIEGFENLYVGATKEALLDMRPRMSAWDDLQKEHPESDLYEIVSPHEQSGASSLHVQCEFESGRVIGIQFAWMVSHTDYDELKGCFLALLSANLGEDFSPGVVRANTDEESDEVSPILIWDMGKLEVFAFTVPPPESDLPGNHGGYFLMIKGPEAAKSGMLDRNAMPQLDQEMMREVYDAYRMPYNGDELGQMAVCALRDSQAADGSNDNEKATP